MRNITMDWPSQKLNHEIPGFFTVIWNKKDFVSLQILQSIKIHNVLHPNLLQTILLYLSSNEKNQLLSPGYYQQ